MNQPSRCRTAGSNPAKSFPILQVTSTANADATLGPLIVSTLDAGRGNKCWVIGPSGLLISYYGGTVGTGIIQFDSGVSATNTWTTRFSFVITSAGLAPVQIPKAIKFPAGQDVRIIIKAGGSGVLGNLVLLDYWVEDDMDPAAG